MNGVHNMALQFEVETLEGIDEGLHGLYAEHNGKFRLSVSGIDPADELKEALRKERKRVRRFKDQYRQRETNVRGPKGFGIFNQRRGTFGHIAERSIAVHLLHTRRHEDQRPGW